MRTSFSLGVWVCLGCVDDLRTIWIYLAALKYILKMAQTVCLQMLIVLPRKHPRRRTKKENEYCLNQLEEAGSDVNQKGCCLNFTRKYRQSSFWNNCWDGVLQKVTREHFSSLAFIESSTGGRAHVYNMIEGLYLKCGWRPLSHWIVQVFVAWVMGSPTILESDRLFFALEGKSRKNRPTSFWAVQCCISCSAIALTNFRFLKWGRNAVFP